MGDRQAYGWVNQWASWHLNWLHEPFSKAHWLCSDAAGINKSSGRKRVKWAERERVWVRPRLIRQPRAGIQQLNGYTESEHHKWHCNFPILARHTTWWLPHSVPFVWMVKILFSIYIGQLIYHWLFPASNYRYNIGLWKSTIGRPLVWTFN